MNHNIAWMLGAILIAGSATAQTTTYTGPSSGGNSDSWNIPGNWDNGVPSGAASAIVPNGITTTADNGALPAYTGNLTLLTNSTLRIEWLGGDLNLYRAWGTAGQTVITAHEGSLINCRAGGAITIPEIYLEGDLTIVHSQSTQGSIDITYDHGVSGPGTLVLAGKGGSDAYLNTANACGGLILREGSGGNGMRVHANVDGACGNGDVTIEATSSGGLVAYLQINATNAIKDTATLTLEGHLGSPVLVLNTNETVNMFKGESFTFPAGTYGAIGSGANTELACISGPGTLTVTSGEPVSGFRGELGVWKPWANGGMNPATGAEWAKGDQYRLAFVTSGSIDAVSTNIADYNAFVSAVARSSTVSRVMGQTTWKVIGSSPTINARGNTETDPTSNGVGVAIFLMDGQSRIAQSNSDLWSGSIDLPLILDESGTSVGTTSTHTGSDASGNMSGTRTFGGDGGGAITTGEAHDASTHWMIQFNTAVANKRPVYALSGMLTVQTAPGTLILLY